MEITNLSSGSGVVIADAIRFGVGDGDIVRPGPNTISGFPRDEECQRYWAESEAGNNAVGMPNVWECSGCDDNSDNVGTAGRWAREMNRQDVNNDRWRRVHVEYHSNAAGCAGGPPCSAKGTICLVSASAPTTFQNAFAVSLCDKIEADMLAIDDQFEYLWMARSNPLVGEYGAISTNANGNEFDSTLIEVAFHDNEEDAANLRSAKVRDAVARSTVQGLVQWLSNASVYPGTQVPNAFLPDAPEKVRAVHDGNGNIVVSWNAPPTGTALGGAATGYKIYRSTNGYGFGQAVTVGNVLTATLSDIPAETTTYLRVAATNAGGESMPSESLAVRRPATGAATVLIVNGYDRVGRHQNVIQQLPAPYNGPMERPIARKVNAFDYIVQHAAALEANNRTFDSCSNDAVIAGSVSLGNYAAVVWILGRESSLDKTFNSTEQTLVTNYLNAGGRLFTSGTDIGFDLVSAGGGVSFYQNTLKCTYSGDNAGTFTAAGTGGCMTGVTTFDFDPASGAPYVASFPDRILPQAGATNILTYVGGTGDGAGIQYDSGTYRLVMFAFPFETITSAAVRTDVMGRAIGFLLGGAPPTACQPTSLSGFEGYINNTQVIFRQPNFSSTTSGNIVVRPNVAIVSDGVSAHSGVKVYKLEWQWIDSNPSRWLRLVTTDTANVPNPTIDLRRAVRVHLRYEGPAGSALRVSLGIRETGVDVPIGANGGTTGTIEWVEATSIASGAPQGILITPQPGVWQTLTFVPSPGNILPFTGDGVLSAPNNKGVLEHLAFASSSGVGAFNVYLDSIEQLCPAPADFDGDGDVDIEDFAHLQGCFSGPDIPPSAPCVNARLDLDDDVDVDDYTVFENCLSGPNVWADLDCAN